MNIASKCLIIVRMESNEGVRFLQSEFWAEFKASHGWKASYFLVRPDKSLEPLTNTYERSLAEGENGSRTVVLTVLTRTFSVARFLRRTLAYIPMAPEFPGAAEAFNDNPADFCARTASALSDLAEALRPHLPGGTLLIRFDPAIDFPSPDVRDSFKIMLSESARKSGLPVRAAPVSVQPPDTVVLDLLQDEDKILGGMKSKWRYNIRLAAKRGVTVSRHFGSDADFDEKFWLFYGLFMQTSERDGVSFHGRDYYADLLRRGAALGEDARMRVTLYLARHEDDYIAGIITLFCGREAVYLYGASGNVKRNLMPAYLLQWTAIQDARAFGSPCYDFYGMPPTDSESHPMHGLYLFKTGFGGAKVHRPGSFDVPLGRGYRLYLAAEKLRAWWHRSLLKRLRGR